MEITSNSKVIEVLDKVEGAKDIFLKLGYKCIDCAVNIEDTLLIAAKYHRKDVNELLHLLKEAQSHNSSPLDK
ncbi:MAG: hypothetical protein ACK4NF_04665 [Planctomycetota bacterium]